LTDPPFKPLVLCFHSVSHDWEHQLAVRPALFERLVRGLLRRRFRPVPADRLLMGGRRSLHVTFDDAYADIEGALETLQRLGVPATIFASTEFADSGRPLAVPELAEEAAQHPERLATMDWERLRDVAARGFTIGSHTISHPHLRSLTDAELERELAESRQRIEDELGAACELFAYPFGEHDERVRAAVRRNGYRAAFALWEGSSRRNLFALPRTDIYRGDSLFRATLKTTFVKPFASALLDRLGRVS